MLKTIEAVDHFQKPEIHKAPDGHLVRSYANGKIRVIDGYNPRTIVSLGSHRDFLEINQFGSYEYNKAGEIDSVSLKEPSSHNRIPVMSFVDKPNGTGYEYDVYSSYMFGDQSVKLIGSASGRNLHFAIAYIACNDPALLEEAEGCIVDQAIVDYLRTVIAHSEKRVYLARNKTTETTL